MPVGDFSTFDSPVRSQHATPSAGRRSPDKALPPVPAWNSLYNTPRKPARDDVDDSSAGETPKSPQRQDDSEAGTPDQMASLRKKMGQLPIKSAPVVMTLATMSGAQDDHAMDWKRENERPTAAKRDSWVGRSFRAFKDKCSPGRGEIPRGEIVRVKEKRVRSQSRREAHRQHARHRRYSASDSGSDAENDGSELPIQKSVSPRKTSGRLRHKTIDEVEKPAEEPHWVSQLFTFIGQHPTVPHILSFYAQLAFNVFLLAMFSYILWCFWSAIQGDVNKKAFEASADIIAEISQCAHDFKINGCASPTRAPALQEVCATWAKCMNRDPMKVARAKVSAQSFAEIFNSFVDALSWKSITVAAAFVLGGLLVSNVAFSKLRHSASAEQPWAHPYQHVPATPQTQRQFSGQDGVYGGTPWRNVPGLEPMPSGQPHIEGRGSPVRKLAF